MIRDDMKNDIRTLKHRMRRNETTPDQVQKHLDSLPDEAAESESTRTEFTTRWEGKTRS